MDLSPIDEDAANELIKIRPQRTPLRVIDLDNIIASTVSVAAIISLPGSPRPALGIYLRCSCEFDGVLCPLAFSFGFFLFVCDIVSYHTVFL
jgi:hypothetical protein